MLLTLQSSLIKKSCQSLPIVWSNDFQHEERDSALTKAKRRQLPSERSYSGRSISGHQADEIANEAAELSLVEYQPFEQLDHVWSSIVISRKLSVARFQHHRFPALPYHPALQR